MKIIFRDIWDIIRGQELLTKAPRSSIKVQRFMIRNRRSKVRDQAIRREKIKSGPDECETSKKKKRIIIDQFWSKLIADC
jgi:hypothetical protein